ncbi:zinc ribbon domain-containing protein [Finegoldia magna]|uniref:zinc ribbon domain-containing protein n=1 Tax=Finegoldia magna TaxID=1260 RepID=UPI000B9183BC|nr:zinc ribbon domain-containing protein [Finegoldia magna]MDU5069951.1 zinc-ribbon domain-containing protein [Finegoldia magna]MDU7478617.1 zinc-ribbon domain-containing protein [Finegoldia magna]OXZ34067.1 zinc ribbon domain-containing protein [Finegoldia magna]
MRCPNCNEKVLDTVNFCHNCGFNLKEYRESLNEQKDIEEQPKDSHASTDKDYSYSDDVMNIFNIKNREKSAEEQKAEEIINKNKSEHKPKRIEDIFQVINKNKSQYGKFNPDKEVEKKINHEDEKEPEENYENTIFITKGYDENQEKIKRDESIRFTSANEFTIHKIEEENDDEDEFMDTFEVKTKQVFDRINLFFTKILKKMMGGAQPYRFSMRIAVVILSALPLLFFYMNSTNHWTFTQKSKAIVVMVSVLVLDVFQKVLSYSMGLKLSGTKLYQPIDKDLRYNISVLLSVIESLIFSLFGVLTAGGLVGFSSSVFTFTFLGAHAFIYLISLVILILFATIILVDRFDYKNLWKIYGLNAAGIVITRLVVFMVVMTLLQKIFFGLAPGLM